jgi:hypothetical protein
LLGRASEWDAKGDNTFFRELSSKARSSYRDAIVSHLQADKRPLFVFAEKEKANHTSVSHVSLAKSGEALSRLGIDSHLFDLEDQSAPQGDTPKDDKLAALLNKYYQASAGAEGWHLFSPSHEDILAHAYARYTSPEPITNDAKSMVARNTAAAWAALVSESNAQKVKSWSFLGDAMLKSGQPKEAARSLAGAHKIQPNYAGVLETYEVAKRQQGTSTYFDAKAQISQERPLTREDVLDFGLKGEAWAR